MSQAFLDPQGSTCTEDCECNNFHYTGACVDGLCVSTLRGSCDTQGQARACVLPPHARVKRCTEGVQICQPPALKTYKKWGDCQLEVSEHEIGALACTDGKDNDCDGKIDVGDEDCAQLCRPGVQKTCYTGPLFTLNRGGCRPGLKICKSDRTWGPCEGEIGPSKEACDGKDNDCDGKVDEGFDADGDGYAPCEPKDPSKMDCDDTDKAVYPGAPEVCDGKDNNCNGSVDEGPDEDGDGFTACKSVVSGKIDCDDTHAKSYPGAPEVCDGKDNDCDGEIDEGLTGDKDGDGFALCPEKDKSKADCDDTNRQVHPEAQEVCDGVDNNCNGSIDEGFAGACVTTITGDSRCTRESVSKGALPDCYRDGPVMQGQLDLPHGLAFDRDNNLYIAEEAGARIRKISMVRNGVCGASSDYTGLCISTVVGAGGKGSQDGPARAAKLGYLEGLAYGPDGGLYFTEQNTHRIRKLHEVKDGKCGGESHYSGLCVTTVAGSSRGDHDGGADQARFMLPAGLSWGADGVLYVADSHNHKIRKLTLMNKGRCAGQEALTGLCVETLAGGLYEKSSRSGPALESGFYYPKDVVMGLDGALYVADSLNHRIRKIEQVKGVQCGRKSNYTGWCVSTYAGVGLNGGDYIDGPALEVKLQTPEAIAVGPDGALYFAEAGLHRIRKIAVVKDAKCGRKDGYSGPCVTFVAGIGRGIRDGTSQIAMFNRPTGLAFDKFGFLYVSDSYNHRVRKIQLPQSK